MTFDELRVAHPLFGFAAYAIEPGAPVTLEIFAFGNVASYSGPTLDACVEQAFSKPNGLETAPPVATAPEPPTADVFD